MGVCSRRALAGRIDCYWQYNRTCEIPQRRVNAQVPWQRVPSRAAEQAADVVLGACAGLHQLSSHWLFHIS